MQERVAHSSRDSTSRSPCRLGNDFDDARSHATPTAISGTSPTPRSRPRQKHPSSTRRVSKSIFPVHRGPPRAPTAAKRAKCRTLNHSALIATGRQITLRKLCAGDWIAVTLRTSTSADARRVLHDDPARSRRRDKARLTGTRPNSRPARRLTVDRSAAASATTINVATSDRATPRPHISPLSRISSTSIKAHSRRRCLPGSSCS